MTLSSILLSSSLVAITMGGAAVADPAAAQQVPGAAQVDDIVVTGSRLAGASRLAPVEVLDRDALAVAGGDVSRVIALLTANSGSEAQVDQLNQPQSSGTAQFNLRNLGLGSTLVLVDGQRWTNSAVVATDGSAYTDINSLVPMIAIERIEAVKDGASAIYGSDAVAGVVNFVTRRGVARPELSISHDLGRGFGETTIQALGGLRIANADLTLAASHLHRSALGSDERDFTQAERYGRAAWTAVTSYGQPGSYFRPSTRTFAPDPDCDNPAFEEAFRNGASDAFCRLDYSDFFDLAPEETRTQLFADVRAAAGQVDVWFQAAGSDTFTRARQSPSLPILARSLTVPTSHPDNPFAETVQFRGRLLGAEAGASYADFNYRTWRLAGGLSGETAGWRWSTSATASRQHVAYDKPDVVGSALQNALNGLGGVGCNPSAGSPGVGECLYFNPFGSAYLGTGTSNSADLIQSLIGSTGLRGAARLATMDVQADRRLIEGRWGEIDLVLGGQVRDSGFRHDWSDLVNAGELLTAGFSPDFSGEQRTWAAFAEARIGLGQRLEAQVAVRQEGQGGRDALSPRIAARFAATDNFAVRASWGRGYRLPSVFATSGAQAAQPSVFDRGAFVFVNTLATGDPDLRPERSSSTSLGAIWTPLRGVTLTLDGWRFDYDDLVIKESAQSVIDQAARDEAAGLTGTPSLARLTRSSSGALTFVALSFVNASSIQTQGVDLGLNYEQAMRSGRVKAGARWTYVDRYEIRVGAGAGTVSGVGLTNLNTLARSLPRNRGEASLWWSRPTDSIGLIAHYIDGYSNDRSGVTQAAIASSTTLDVSYARDLSNGVELSISAINVTDRDPPLAQFALGYDPVVADPRGRVVRIGLSRRF